MHTDGISTDFAPTTSAVTTRRERDVSRWFLIPLAGFGIVGAAVGFAIGLVTYWRTAPFAALELGIPAAVLGALVGLVSMAARVGHLRRSARRHTS